MSLKSSVPAPKVVDSASQRSGVATSLVGRYNRGLVLESVRLHPDASRVEIAARTGLTTAGVSNIVRVLLAEGLIVEQGLGKSHGGKPRVPLRIRGQFRYAAGIHLRPHSIGIALADLDGTVVGKATESYPRIRSDPENVLRRAAAMIEQLRLSAGVAEDALLGVGVACPGPIDTTRRVIIEAPNLPRWHEVPIADVLEGLLGQPVTLENNANAAAMGDKWLGVARDLPSLLYIYLGVGIGGAIFLDHLLYRGKSGNAGAIGHVMINPGGERCRCGNIGCLETVCSEHAMIKRVRDLIPDAKGRLGLRLTTASLDADHRRIMAAAAGGDLQVATAIAPSLEQLGAAIASLLNVLDVGHVVIGGPAAVEAPALYLDAIRDALRTLPIARSVQHVEVMHSTLGDLAAVLGATSVIFHQAYAPNLRA